MDTHRTVSGHMRQFAPDLACWLAPTVVAKGFLLLLLFFRKVFVAKVVAMYTLHFWMVLRDFAE